jgi:hypothetical protein
VSFPTRPFALSERHEGDEAYAFYAHFSTGGEHEQFVVHTVGEAPVTLSGPLSDWMADRGIENFELSVVYLTLIISIADENLAFEFRMTYC